MSVVSAEAVAKAIASLPRAKVATAGTGSGDSKNVVKRLRDRHHQMARMVAADVPREQICKVMGVTDVTLDMLIEQTPAFIELIATYRPRAKEMQAALENYVDLINNVMITSELALRDKLMAEADEMSASVLNKLSMDRADRLGYGKQSLNVNVNLDLRARLESRARKRRSSPPAGVGDGGVSSLSAEQGSTPLLELKAEPVVQPPQHPTPTEAPSARPPGWEHPVAKHNREKYSGNSRGAIDRRI